VELDIALGDICNVCFNNVFRMKIYHTKNFPGPAYWGICLWPLGIFLRKETKALYYKLYNDLVRHEKTHWEQQKEMGGILFYFWYSIEYIIKLMLLWNHYKAYDAVSFEREANCFEHVPEYLSNRKRYAWLRFIF